MSRGIVVREATIQDALGIARVQVDTWRSTYRGIVPDSHLASMSYDERAERWRAMRIDPAAGYGTFVAETPERHIVGFAGGGPERGGDEVHKGELYAIYVLADDQGAGIGRRLVAAVVDRLVAAGFSSLKVWVLERNPNRRFYERLGGQPAGAKELNYIDGVTLREVAYGWLDALALRAACASSEEGVDLA